jgi:hypothetical protein
MVDWVTWVILGLLLLLVIALYLIARRAYTDFRKGMDEGRG